MATMGNFRLGNLTSSSPMTIARGLALAADRSLWADDQSGCIAIIDRIYDLFDALEMGFEPDVYSQILAAETAAWIGGKELSEEFLSSVYAPN